MTKKQEQEIKRIYKFLGKCAAHVFVCQNFNYSLAKGQQVVETICEGKEVTMKYSPKNFPEVTVFYEFLPAEYDYTHGCQVCPADINIHELYINGDRAASLEDCLFEKFGDLWEREILELKEVAWT